MHCKIVHKLVRHDIDKRFLSETSKQKDPASAPATLFGQITQPQSRTDYSQFFYPRTVADWSTQPAVNVVTLSVTAPSLG